MTALALHMPSAAHWVAFGFFLAVLAVGWVAWEAHVAPLCDEDGQPLDDPWAETPIFGATVAAHGQQHPAARFARLVDAVDECEAS